MITATGSAPLSRPETPQVPHATRTDPQGPAGLTGMTATGTDAANNSRIVARGWPCWVSAGGGVTGVGVRRRYRGWSPLRVAAAGAAMLGAVR